MNFESLQQSWQSHDHAVAITINGDAIYREVRRNQSTLEGAVLRRDFVEVLLGISMAAFWCYLAVSGHQLSLIVPAIGTLAVAVFLTVDRWLQRSRRAVANDTLSQCLTNSLREIDHQVWILRNAWWWYFLPLSIGAVVFFATLPISPQAPTWTRPVGTLLATVVCLIAFGIVYRMNRVAVRNILSVRREELIRLAQGLNDAA